MSSLGKRAKGHFFPYGKRGSGPSGRKYPVERERGGGESNDCLRRVIKRHQTSRSSSGIVYPASTPAGARRGTLGGLGTPVFVATIMLIYLPCLPSLSLPLATVPVSTVGDNLPGTQKRVDNLKGKSSLLTQEGHGTANARASSCSIEHNTSRSTRKEREPLSVPFSFGRRSTTLSHGPTQLPLSSSFGLTSHFLARRRPFLPPIHLPLDPLDSPVCFLLLIPGRF